MQQDISEISKKAGVLIEAISYIKRFRGSVFVVKYGGAFMDDPNPQIRASVANDIAFLATVGIKTVVVHGGGKAINRAMAAAGLKPEFRNGMRVTDEKTVSIVEDVLNNSVNGEIVDLLRAGGCEPISIKGNEVLKCKKLVPKSPEGEDVDIGYVGVIDSVDAAPIEKVLDEGIRHMQFHYHGIFLEVLERLGKMPLPPYIKKQIDDNDDYQTVYAKVPGSAAAPTAGFHFTPELFEKIQKMGVEVVDITLNIGLGT